MITTGLSNHSSVMLVLAGVAIFMYGMSIASSALQELTSNRIRDLFSQLSRKPILAVLVGIAITVCLQSSGAVTSMLVGLGSAKVVSLTQVMGIILGTAVGTTFTVQLISFNVAQWGLPIFTISFVVYFVTRWRKLRMSMAVLMGFGLIFFGIEIISTGTEVIRYIPHISEVFKELSNHPVLALVISAVVTAFLHSSAVTIGLAMGFASSGLISLTDSIYWVFGANIGTTSTAILASLGGNYIGRQVAWAHFAFKTLSVLLGLLFISLLVGFLEATNSSIARSIANAHTLFNIASTILFFPFISMGARWIERMFPPRTYERDFGAKYLNQSTYHSSTLAFAHARREIQRMGDIVETMARDSIQLLAEDDPELISNIRERDNKVDFLLREIKQFLLKFTNETSDYLDQEVFYLISLAHDIENAADVVDNGIVSIAQKRSALKVNFSAEGWDELKQFHTMILKIMTLSLTCFQLGDSKIAAQVIVEKRRIRMKEMQLRESHYERINMGRLDSINTSSIHLDLLSDYKRIVSLFANHAYYYLQNGDDKKTANNA